MSAWIDRTRGSVDPHGRAGSIVFAKSASGCLVYPATNVEQRTLTMCSSERRRNVDADVGNGGRSLSLSRERGLELQCARGQPGRDRADGGLRLCLFLRLFLRRGRDPTARGRGRDSAGARRRRGGAAGSSRAVLLSPRVGVRLRAVGAVAAAPEADCAACAGEEEEDDEGDPEACGAAAPLVVSRTYIVCDWGCGVGRGDGVRQEQNDEKGWWEEGE